MTPKLTKTDLIAAVALACDLPDKLASLAVNTAINSITHALSQGKDVRLTGFGTFSTRTRPQRTGRNPQTGQPIIVPEARIVRFVPGIVLHEAVKQ